MTNNKKLFLSAVSSEFLAYLELLAQDLKGPTLDVAVGKDFIVTGASTLEKLDEYIRACDGIVHLIGKATGDIPGQVAVAALLEKYPDFATKLLLPPPLLNLPLPSFSYTQWEAYLALYHGRPLFVYLPDDFESAALTVPRDGRFKLDNAEFESQKAHYRRICERGHDRGVFRNEERLSSAVLRALYHLLPAPETTVDVAPTKLRHTAEHLIGRDEDLARLDAAWNDPQKNVVVIRAFGGMGKTSLVATWMAELASKKWRGAVRVFDWSFYSQGTSDHRSASADLFIADALKTFGDPNPTLGSAWERGARLAQLVGRARCLLVLDGLEPLQYVTGSMGGELKDDAIKALLKGLAASNAGLCVVTTRARIPDIQQYYGRTADDFELRALTDLAGAALLYQHGATRAGACEIGSDDQELQATSRDVRGHGLTLQLLGRYLALAENGDIRKRDTVRLTDADHEYGSDATRPYGHAFKAMEAYERWFERKGEMGQRQLAVLRLLGLFDRPAPKNCLDALQDAPVIAGLTEHLVGLGPRDWNIVTTRLKEIDLLIVQADGSLDAHPLLREYFSQRLRRTQHGAWQTAHRRLYEHLSATTREGSLPTLEDIQPLYQAVAHGCLAGLRQEVYTQVFLIRILRKMELYSCKKLGAMGSDLGAVACFFETPWSRLLPGLTEIDQIKLLNSAAYYLQALGRQSEALEPMRAALNDCINRRVWELAVFCAGNTSELELTLGMVSEALKDAEKAVSYAGLSDGPDWWGIRALVIFADALHQAGHRAAAEESFIKAERRLAEVLHRFPLLHSMNGFRYCDLLLTKAERTAWQILSSRGDSPSGPLHDAKISSDLQSCASVFQRATQTLKWAEKENVSSLDIALDKLTRTRATLYAEVLSSSSSSDFNIATSYAELAVTGLRHANQQQCLPLGLLTRAWLRCLTGTRTGPESAQSDLDEAWEIAKRGPMPLLLADIHLYRARLFGGQKDVGGKSTYPWESAQADLSEARSLIEKHGYWRRKEELNDAETAFNLRRGQDTA